MSEQAPDEAVTAGEVESEDVSCEQSADASVDELRQQAEDNRNEYINAYSTSLDAFAAAYKLQQTGHKSTRSDRERAADLGSQAP